MKPWIFLSTTEGAIALAAEAQLIPDNLTSILVQLPLVAVIIWLQLQNQKWLEHMLEVQRTSIKETYEGQQNFLGTLIERLSDRQDQLNVRLEGMTKQITILSATLGEIVNVQDALDMFMERIPRPSDSKARSTRSTDR